MSVVYRATQTLPIKRDVAIKVLKRGMDSEAFLRRFDLERRVLSSMEHPNIATVLDAGVSPEGQPYFVMELVRGPGLIEYCDKRELGVRQRIEIFLQVCRAVHHAHMRAVIHRDLKPSNVLVTEHDGVALPKVIDFGVAKAIHLPIEGGHTWHGESVGTPAYMSPEHWNPEVDIDIRADVYSLGLVLFELLSGRFPYPFETVNARDVHAVRTAMERSEPTRMSTLVGEGRDSPSPVGGITGSELAQLLRGDLDAVLLMAVAKDRDQRYQSVDAFADDLNRFLTHRPTHARPPGLLHSVRMFCHRHQTLSAASALIAIGVAAAIGATGYHFARIDREFNRTKEALIRSEVAEGDATARAQELQLVMEFQSAQIGRATPERMGDYLRAHIIEAARAEDQHLIRDAFKHINFTDVGLMSLREGLFEPTGSAIDIQFVDQPIIKAQLLESLGNTLHQVGLIDAASEAIARTVEIRREYLGDK
ncbi:MAG: serine/threonine-protein kinase, partial [Planctomycetota bacterium]